MQKIFIEHPSDTGQRIDRFLKKYFPNIALGAIYKMLRTGKIKINGKKKDQTYKIELWDEVQFWLSDEEIVNLKEISINQKAQYTTVSKENISLEVLFEDDYLMVINKPSWMNVHPGDHKTKEISLIERVQDMLAQKYDSLTFRPSLVHRIDRDTSGCILIAKEKRALEQLLWDLQSHKIEKIYHALVSWVPPKKHDTIRAKILRIDDAKNEAKVRIDETGQTAVTHYTVISQKKSFSEWKESWFSDFSISLLECRIETGRTHQIRVHLASSGIPILWDKAYGDKKVNSYISRVFGISRQMLHARKLSFTHPITKKMLHVEAPYPSDWQSI